MSSVTDIVNLALARLGDVADVANISPPDGSTQADYAARFYPTARDSLLEMHDFAFATTFAALASLTNTHAQWSYAYALPAECIKVIGVVPTTLANDDFIETIREEIDAFGRPAWLDYLQRGFRVMSGVVYSNEAEATFAYTQRVTDPTKFTPLFERALSWMLASDIAGPLLKGQVGQAATIKCLQMAQAVLGQAAVSDANQQRVRPAHTPAWIAGR